MSPRSPSSTFLRVERCEDRICLDASAGNAPITVAIGAVSVVQAINNLSTNFQSGQAAATNFINTTTGLFGAQNNDFAHLTLDAELILSLYGGGQYLFTARAAVAASAKELLNAVGPNANAAALRDLAGAINGAAFVAGVLSGIKQDLVTHGIAAYNQLATIGDYVVQTLKNDFNALDTAGTILQNALLFDTVGKAVTDFVIPQVAPVQLQPPPPAPPMNHDPDNDGDTDNY
jgi:hypothetical protein